MRKLARQGSLKNGAARNVGARRSPCMLTAKAGSLILSLADVIGSSAANITKSLTGLLKSKRGRRHCLAYTCLPACLNGRKPMAPKAALSGKH